jgi:hypothetical protein
LRISDRRFFREAPSPFLLSCLPNNDAQAPLRFRNQRNRNFHGSIKRRRSSKAFPNIRFGINFGSFGFLNNFLNCTQLEAGVNISQSA